MDICWNAPFELDDFRRGNDILTCFEKGALGKKG